MNVRTLCSGLVFGAVSTAFPQAYLPLHSPQQNVPRGLFGSTSVGIHPRLAAGVVYDDNVTLAPSSQPKLADWVGVISPGVTLLLGETSSSATRTLAVQSAGLPLEVGRSSSANRGLATTSKGLSLDYAAGINFFVRNSRFNSVDHSGRFNAIYPFSDLSLVLQQSVDIASDNLTGFELTRPTDEAIRSRRRSYVTLAQAQYRVSDRLTLQLGANQNLSDVERGIDSKDWQGQLYVNYGLGTRTTFGLGGEGGLRKVDPGITQYNEQARARLAYDVSDLVRIDASAGVEWRQFEKGQGQSVNPVFDVGATYAPSERTRLSLQGGRRIQSSAIRERQNYTDTGVALTWSQGLGQRLAYSANVYYRHLKYETVTGNTRVDGRSDDTYGAQFGVSFAMFTRLVASAFYRLRANDSALATTEYNEQLSGLSLTWEY